ncbi:pickpocket protein 28 [Frankliniella occidentalis]|uniref:Pickpocket protein 28 n=1 Tax=Frankliniella occidentalis TaxID=133901 RepID=A0A9C6XQ27_FRAOC|nr:pickpocket protein 28 [Frankliniella occidentalis]
MYWDVDEGYPGPPPGDDNTNNSNTCPRRAAGGLLGGIMAVVTVALQEVDFSCVPNPDFTLVVHNVAELPFVDLRTQAQLPAQSLSDIPLSGQQSYLVPHSKSTTVIMKPIRVISNPRLRSYSPASRNCYFTGEKELHFFRVYTLQNCRLECLTNLTWQMCNCTAFYQPQIEGVQVCYSTKKITCSNSIEGKYKDTDCNCLPGCNSLQYDTRSIQSDIVRDDDDDEPYLYGIVKLVFSDLDYSPYVREARISSLEFLGES